MSESKKSNLPKSFESLLQRAFKEAVHDKTKSKKEAIKNAMSMSTKKEVTKKEVTKKKSTKNEG